MSPTGPHYPTAASDIAASGFTVWSNPTNVFASDGNSATATINPFDTVGHSTQPTDALFASGFNFGIPPTAVIDGIVVEMQGANSLANSNTMGLTKASVAAGTAKSITWPTGGLFSTYGGAADLWGTTWTVSDINNSGFGVSVRAATTNTGASGSASIDAIRVTVYWHTPPAEVPKRYLYKVYKNGQFIGNLPTPISEFGYSQDINTSGSPLTVEVPITADTASQPVDVLTDESDNTLTDESGNVLTNEGVSPMISTGLDSSNTLIKNGNQIIVWEFSYYYPNGHIRYRGQIDRWEAEFGGLGGDTIKLYCLSDGVDFDNYLTRGSPFTYTNDQVQTTFLSSAYDYVFTSGGSWLKNGQTFTVGVGVTNIGAVSLMLNGTATVTVKLYSNPFSTTLLGAVSQSVSVSSPTAVQFGFSSPITVTSGASYFFSVEVADGDNINVHWAAANVYAGGTYYQNNFSGGGGGGSWVSDSTNDLYFVTASSTGSTTATYSSVDPTTGMLQPIVDDYKTRGGVIDYDTGTVDATGLSLTVTFNTETILDAIKRILSVSPSGFYYYVDVGSDTLYFKQTATSADFTLIRGKHINSLRLVASIENVKNQLYFSGGLVSTTNLYKIYSDAASIATYGVRLDRKSDNRVTLAATADAIGNSFIAESKDEQYQTVVVVQDRTMDISLFRPGKVIGFSGYGTFIDSLKMQIVRIDFTPDQATLTLGILPKRLSPELERITRGLIAEQTIANPSAPS